MQCAHGLDVLDGICPICEKGATQDATPNILQVADELTSRDRNESYGHPLDDYSCTARLWNAMLLHAGVINLNRGTDPITPELAQAMMIAVKLSRLSQNMAHIDTLTDIAGYARTIEMTIQERKRRHENVSSALDSVSDDAIYRGMGDGDARRR